MSSSKLTKKRTLKKQKQHDEPGAYMDGLTSELNGQVRAAVYPGVQYLIRTDWFQLLRNKILPLVHKDTVIENIDTREFRCLNILKYLAEFSGNTTSQTTERVSELSGLLAKLSVRDWKLDNKSRYQLRRLLEIDNIGRQLKTAFFDWLKDPKQSQIELDNTLLLNPFTSIINLAEMHTQVRYRTVINWSCGKQLDGIPDQLEIFSTLDSDKLAPEDVIVYCRVMAMFNLLLKTKRNPTPVSVYMINYRKEFMQVKDKADLVFTSSEINTGVCNGVSIIISRKEESAKTLIHELIHFHDLDFKYETPELDKLVKKITNGNLATSQTGSTGEERFNIGEAHTECLASILYILFNTFTDPEPVFTSRFTEQIIYTLAKQADILRVAECTSIQHRTCQLRESTNLYSYFFIKSYIYFSLREWLEGCCTGPKFRHQSPAAYRNLQRIITSGSQNPLLSQVVAYLQKQRHSPGRYRASNTTTNIRSLKMMAVS